MGIAKNALWTRRRTTAGGWLLAGAFVLAMGGCNRPVSHEASAFAPQGATLAKAATKSGYATVNSARFFYRIYGNLNSGKTPLLVLHGSFMSSDGMKPLIEPLAQIRPVIAFDAHGHGRTGDLPGAFTYAQMAADAAGVLDALKVPKADVLGYSMGGVTALTMAVRYPAKVGKQIIVSGVSERRGWWPGVLEGMAKIKPSDFANGPLEAAYKSMSPTPRDFPTLVADIRAQEAGGYDQPAAAVRAIREKTMVVVGDTDGVQLEHAVALFRLRGGGDAKAGAQGFLPDSPRARLAILPATGHIGVLTEGPLIAELAGPFLDDKKPTIPPGFM